MAELDKLGLRDNTIIVFAVDHGYQLGEKGKWSKAGSLFEMGTRVPLMMAVPKMQGNGKSCYRIVQSLDIFPTITELCGLPNPKGLEGTSLTPLLKEPAATWDQPAYSVWSEDGTTLHGVAGLELKNGATPNSAPTAPEVLPMLFDPRPRPAGDDEPGG